MNITELILVAFLVWQISAMPIPNWIASAFFSVDGEDYNSSSEWAENKFSLAHNNWSYLIFSLEFIKGLVAVSIIGFVHSSSILLFGEVPFEYVLAFIIIMGHTFPVYSEFNRSRSTGAYFGVFAGIWLIPTLFALVLFLILWAVYKKVIFSSLIVSIGILVIVTFMLFDVKALVIASIFSISMLGSNFQPKLQAVKV